MKKSFGLRKPDKKFNLDPENVIILRDRSDYYPIPVVYYFVDYFGPRIKKYYGGKISFGAALSLGAFEKGWCRNMFGPKKEFLAMQEAIIKKIFANPRFVSKTYKKSFELFKQYYKFSKGLLKENPRALSEKSLTSLHKKWMELYAEYSFWNVVIWFMLQDKLANRVNELMLSEYSLTLEELHVLETPNRPSYVYREESELLQIALNFSDKKLALHEDKWRWLPYDYIGPKTWSKDDFVKRIQSFGDKKKIQDALKERKNDFISLKKKQKQLAVKYKISKKHQRILEDMKLVTLMQDEKKEVCTLAQFALQEIIFKAAAQKLGIRNRECIKLHHEELWAALRGEIEVKDVLRKRLHSTCAVQDKDGMFFIDGAEAERIFNLFSLNTKGVRELQGQCASVGKAKGTARILLTSAEVRKVRKGDILITAMTSPDYIMGMKKAGAIVTNEGGLTSHAAIVSRELKIPCVVGTKIATWVFKDGDPVEVDADNGTVKIIKH